MGGGGGIDKFPLQVKYRFIDDILGLFHHYHHHEEGLHEVRNSKDFHEWSFHEIHHCTHALGLDIVHCGCKTIHGKVQHAINSKRTNCMLHIPDITGIREMILVFKEPCPVKNGYYHMGSLKTEVVTIRDQIRAAL